MTLFEVRDLVLEYGTRDHPVRAVDGVSFTIEEGDSLGIIGESGCGKSSLLYAVFRLLRSNARIVSGSVRYHGQDILAMTPDAFRSLRWKEMAMVFQGAMNALNPVIRIGSLLGEAYRQHNPSATKEQVSARVQTMLEMVRIDPRIASSYPHELSGGMRQRVVIAMSLICEPKLLFADEPTTALDVVLQHEIMTELEELKKRMGFALVLVTHDLSLVEARCRQMAVMYAGQFVEIGLTKEIFDLPRHPYSIGLMQSFPAITNDLLVPIPGAPPNLVQQIVGCRYAPRCPISIGECTTENVYLRPTGRDASPRGVRCIRTAPALLNEAATHA